jgi:hypothetical protein
MDSLRTTERAAGTFSPQLFYPLTVIHLMVAESAAGGPIT